MNPRAGHNVFLVGGVGVGKTFLIRAVVGGLVGGYAEAKEYLMHEDQFGSELFAKGLWTIDDGSIATDPRKHKVFSEMIKRMAANQTFRYHAKFRVPTMVEWLGRVMVSCNADEDSIRIIPDLDISILDKICVFRCIEARPKGFFPEPTEMNKILDRELPWLARYLLDYKIPDHIKGDSRFGIKPYHEPSVVQRAQQSSDGAAFSEILEDWRQVHFGQKEIKADYWDGSSFQLHKAISGLCPGDGFRSYTVAAVGRQLSALKNKGAAYIESPEGKGKVRIWRIYRDDKEASAK